MGCDGGTIPKRDELVRVKKKPEQKDKDAELSFKWRHCAVSQQMLQTPIVACGMGRLYSKSVILENLLDKTNMPDIAKHIKNMKDIKDLNLTKNPAFVAEAEKTEGAIDERGAPYICPVIGLEMSGKFRFIFLWTCGCVISERALKEVKMQICHVCQKPFTPNDVVIINGTDEDLVLMKSRMEERQAKLKSEKKSKSKAKETVTMAETKPSTSADKEVPSSSSSAPKNVDEFEIPLNLPKRQPGVNSVMRPHKRFAPDTSMQDPVYKKTKEDYSVAQDPKASSVYKSLFTSHQSDKDQKRAHWVTYNPFYN